MCKIASEYRDQLCTEDIAPKQHPSGLPMDAMGHQGVDHVMVGECDNSLVRLMDALNGDAVWLGSNCLSNGLTPQHMILRSNFAPIYGTKDNRGLRLILEDNSECKKWIGDVFNRCDPSAAERVAEWRRHYGSKDGKPQRSFGCVGHSCFR